MILSWLFASLITLTSTPMNREVMWVSLDERVFEHLRLAGDNQGIQADGLIIHLDAKESCRLRYTIRCDSLWQVRIVKIQNLDLPDQFLVLESDGNGNWKNAKGELVTSLRGCHDVDIYYSPFTNTLAIRRLALPPTESADINVVFINVPDLKVSAVRQRYAFLQQTSKGGLYRYESLASGFTTELPVDFDGLVIEYPRFFKRVWSR